MVGENCCSGHEGALLHKLVPFEAAGEQIDEAVLNGADPEHILVADSSQRGQWMPGGVASCPFFDGGRTIGPATAAAEFV